DTLAAVNCGGLPTSAEIDLRWLCRGTYEPGDMQDDEAMIGRYGWEKDPAGRGVSNTCSRAAKWGYLSALVWDTPRIVHITGGHGVRCLIGHSSRSRCVGRVDDLDCPCNREGAVQDCYAHPSGWALRRASRRSRDRSATRRGPGHGHKTAQVEKGSVHCRPPPRASHKHPAPPRGPRKCWAGGRP